MSTQTPELVRSQPLVRQIADWVRQQIRDQTWRAGDRVPPASELAARLGTVQATVHRAMVQLTREGLLDRKPKAGTFVRQAQPVLHTVGIYSSSSLIGSTGSPFQQALVAAIQVHLRSQGLEAQLFLDTRPTREPATVWPQLADAVTRREIQGLILPSTNPTITRSLNGLRVPFVALGSDASNTLGVDEKQFVQLAVGGLNRLGSRRIGLLAPTRGKCSDLVTEFIDVVRVHGLEVRDAWIALVDREPRSLHPAAWHQQFGYDAMRRLWAQPERPDGLVVFPDSIASGAIHALLALGVKVPDDLRLVLHRNRGVPLLCPLPATFLEADPDEMAAVLVRQVRELHAGKQVRKVCLRHQVVKQDSPANPTGEASIPDSKTVMSRGSGIPSAVSPSVMRRRT